MQYPTIDNVIVQLGPIALHWYGLMYVAAFVAAWWLGNRRAARLAGWSSEDVSDLVFYGALGVIVGGRLGFALFYGWEHLVSDPLWIFQIWKGGMSFHGGLLGVIAALWWYSRRSGRHWFAVTDFAAPIVPLGLGFGRLGNFINAELPGRVSDSVGFYYPCAAVSELNRACSGAYETVLRHPSSLYQAATDGVVLFCVLWLFALRPRPLGFLSGVFLFCYGGLRLVTELFREPDAHIGFLWFDAITMGQLLSAPMLLGGLVMIFWSRRYGELQAFREPSGAELGAPSAAPATDVEAARVADTAAPRGGRDRRTHKTSKTKGSSKKSSKRGRR